MNQVKAAQETLRQAKEVWPDKVPISDDSFSLIHLEHMVEQLSKPNMSKAKRGRWLGWMQAVVVAQTVLTLEDMKRINKSYSGEEES